MDVRLNKSGKIEISKEAFRRQTPESRMIIQLHEFAHIEYQKTNTMQIIRKTQQERQQIIDTYFSNLPFKEDTARKFLKALIDKRWFYQFPWGDPMEVPLKEMLLPDEGLDNDDYGLKIHAIVEEDNVVKVKFSDVGALAGGAYTFTLNRKPDGYLELTKQETHYMC